MHLRIANAPTSWGVEDPEDGANPSWDRLLADLAAAGYAGTELGPFGYLPTNPQRLRREPPTAASRSSGATSSSRSTRARALPRRWTPAAAPASCWPRPAPRTS